MEQLNELAVTVKDQGTLLMMQRIKKWLEDTEQIREAIGSIENGEKSGKHWQLVIKTVWGAAHTRDKLKQAFPELVGKLGNKANKYSVGELRTSFDNNIAYCLKEYKDNEPKSEEMSIFKGVDKETILQLANATHAEVGERRERGQVKQSSWNDILYANVREMEAETDREIGRAVLTVYHRKRKTFPNKFQLAQLIYTMRALKYDEGSDDLENVFDDLISQAISL